MLVHILSYILGFGFLFLLSIGMLIAAGGGGLGIVRHRTEREEQLHDQIRDAMNWSPDQFHQRKDGRWFNARGEEGVCVTLEELLKRKGRND